MLQDLVSHVVIGQWSFFLLTNIFERWILSRKELLTHCRVCGTNWYRNVKGVSFSGDCGAASVGSDRRTFWFIFQSVWRSGSLTWTLRSLYWRLHRRNFIWQRGIQSIYNFRQFFSPGFKMQLGNFRNFAGFSRYQSFYQWQRFMY